MNERTIGMRFLKSVGCILTHNLSELVSPYLKGIEDLGIPAFFQVLIATSILFRVAKSAPPTHALTLLRHLDLISTSTSSPVSTRSFPSTSYHPLYRTIIYVTVNDGDLQRIWSVNHSFCQGLFVYPWLKANTCDRGHVNS